MFLASETEAVAAWSTFGAVIVALGTPASIAAWRWWHRPKLGFVVGAVEPFVRIEPDPATANELVLRVRVENHGKTEAKRVRVQIRRAWFNSTIPVVRVPPWMPFDIDPMPLRWASRSRADTGPSAEEVDIAEEMDDLVRVLKVDMHNRESYLLGASQTIKWNVMYDIGEYRVELVAFANNAKRVSAVIALDKQLDLLVSGPRLSEPPPLDQCQPSGYLGYLKAGGIGVGDGDLRPRGKTRTADP